MTTPHLQKQPWVILPDDGRGLLRDELALALAALGFTALRPSPAELADPASPNYLPRLIEAAPALFLSVNLQGLLPGAPHTRALLDAGIPTLAWFVDNPWHQLSAMRDPTWKSLTLAVTDASFLEPLRSAGAERVLHMPLAASPQHLNIRSKAPQRLGGIVFAGRSAFPGLDDFFAGQEVPPDTLTQGLRLAQGGFGPPGTHPPRPDFSWWVKALGLVQEQERFWPGKKARKAGRGAVECNIAWRESCLKAACSYPGGLTVFGDPGWKSTALPDLRPPVDYYTELPAIYQAAPFSLSLSSLLLPAGLSQRSFDVWAAGGFALSDWSEGLSIFPAALTEPVTFHTPQEMVCLAAALAADPAKKERLRRDWQAHIMAEHTYEKRLAHALGKLNLL